MAAGRYHWSNAAHSARFFIINAGACVPLLALILHPSWWGLYTAVTTVVFLFWVEKIKKMTLRSFARSINVTLTGRVKSSLNVLKELAR